MLMPPKNENDRDELFLRRVGLYFAERKNVQRNLDLPFSRDRMPHFEHGRIEFELAPGGARDLASNLIQKIQAWTNERWVISVVASGGKSTVKEQRMLKEREKRTDLESDPLVAAVMIEFPGAQIISVRGGEDPSSSAEISEILYDDFAAEDND